MASASAWATRTRGGAGPWGPRNRWGGLAETLVGRSAGRQVGAGMLGQVSTVAENSIVPRLPRPTPHLPFISRPESSRDLTGQQIRGGGDHAIGSVEVGGNPAPSCRSGIRGARKRGGGERRGYVTADAPIAPHTGISALAPSGGSGISTPAGRRYLRPAVRRDAVARRRCGIMAHLLRRQDPMAVPRRGGNRERPPVERTAPVMGRKGIVAMSVSGSAPA